MHLHGLIEHPVAGFAGVEDGRCGELVRIAAATAAHFQIIDLGQGAPDQGFHGFDLGVHLGQQCLHHLEAANRLAELHARPGVLDAQFERTFADAHAQAGHQGALQIEPAHDDLDAFVFLAHQVGCRHAAVVEHQLAGLAAAKAHLDELLRHLEAGEILLDDEGRDALGAKLRRGLGVDQQHVGDRAVGDVDLGAVEDVVVALTVRAGAHGAQRIRAGAGFGQAERADFRAVAQAGQVLAALRLVGVAEDVVDAQVIVRRPRQGDGGVPAREGLADQTRAEQVHARATMLGRHGGPHEASCADFLENIGRPPFLVVHAAREWHEFLARELVGGFEHGAVVGGESKTARGGHVGMPISVWVVGQ